ncbi:MAG: RNase adapter RapZ [Ilumatobacter sp.]|uniref:RNase adapter RapZ n=1 Tax=Ilumatobacter sp. TaxID=1967498 RepID=UPI003C736D4E
MAEIVLITGLSGAGRSGTADVLEDLGWYVVDNLPTALIGTIIDLAVKPGSDIPRLALVGGRQHGTLVEKIGEVRASGHRVRVLFLDASTPELVRRYNATRRRHPLADEAEGLVESIELERERLDPARAAADLVIDTSDLNVHQLKDRVVHAFSAATDSRLQVSVESFGFKHGLPLDADMVMDVRFLPNPHWVPDLRPLTGHDPKVRDHVLETAAGSDFVDRLDDLLASLLPQYEKEGRSYLTVAIGCTGGRHRSVATAEEVASRLRGRGVAVRVAHRDVAR